MNVADTLILSCPDHNPDVGTCSAPDRLSHLDGTFQQRTDLIVPVSRCDQGQSEADFHGNGSELTFMAWYFVTIPELGGHPCGRVVQRVD